MPRVRISQKERQKEFKRQQLGHLIIYCEGQTEEFYFKFFVNIIKKTKFDDIKFEVVTAGGNAKRVFNYAVKHLESEENNRLFSNYDKYLIFDCDAPDNIQEVITLAVECKNSFKMLISNNMFEIWLLMHFENVRFRLTKTEILNKLEMHLKEEYKKADEGMIRKIIHIGEVEQAIINADNLSEKYKQQHLTVYENIEEMNPYTNIQQLIRQLLIRIDDNERDVIIKKR